MVEDNILVKELNSDAQSRWDDFVEKSPGATFFHRAGWKRIIEDAFGHRCYYLYAEKDGDILGILPMGHINSRLFGNSLVSTPLCVYGGIAAVTEEARVCLDQSACDLAQRLNVDYLEMRNCSERHDAWDTKDLYVTFRKSLDPDPDKNFLAIPRKQRAMIRKGINAGLAGELDDDVDRFYDAYSVSVRNLGTPVYSKRYFELLKDEFGDDCEILTITRKARLVSSVMSFYFRDEVLPYYGGGLEEARSLNGNDFMYWDLMRRATERGYKIFDYGRSKKGTGSYRFKKHWGFEPQPLYYEYMLIRGTAVPDVNPLNPKYRMIINLWKRMPVPLTKVIGPLISRKLG